MNAEIVKPPGRGTIRLTALLFPPAGLLVLWLAKGISLGRKLFASLVIVLYMPIYAAAIIVILWKAFGLQYEFRGSGVPALTWRKTLPDYEKLQASRAAHKRSGAATTNN